MTKTMSPRLSARSIARLKKLLTMLVLSTLPSTLIAEFYLVDRGLRHRLPGFSSMGRLVDDKGDYYFGFFPPIALAHFSNHPMTTTTG
jgi:hypothetical protein